MSPCQSEGVNDSMYSIAVVRSGQMTFKKHMFASLQSGSDVASSKTSVFHISRHLCLLRDLDGHFLRCGNGLPDTITVTSEAT